MNHLEEQDVEAMAADEVSFDHFVKHAIELDKATYDQIFDDPVARESFASMSPAERLKQFSPAFQSEVMALYENAVLAKKANHNLAKSVFNIGRLTGSTYQHIAKVLEGALSKQYSKSHISKLYRVGQLLTSLPALASIQDTEKLATISRIPVNQLTQMIERTDQGVRVANLDVGRSSRSKVEALVKKEIPAPVRPAKLAVAPTWDRLKLRQSLTESLPHIDQQSEAELVEAIESCIRIIDGN